MSIHRMDGVKPTTEGDDIHRLADRATIFFGRSAPVQHDDDERAAAVETETVSI